MPGLADFMAALDRRLDTLGAEGVNAALRAAAGRLAPSERPAFLAMFDPLPVVSVDGLVAEIEAFVVGHRHGEDGSDDRRRYRNEWWDDDEVPRSSGEADDLFGRLGERFIAGDWAVAAEGYRRLLYVAVADVDSPDGCVVGGSHEVVQEALARYARCLVAGGSEPVERRAARVIEALGDLGSSLGTPSLAEVLNSHPDSVEDLEAMLAELGALAEDRARSDAAWTVSHFQTLALDIAVLLGGPDGVARLARDRSGQRPDRVWERWMIELVAVGRFAEAIEVGAEAIATLGSSRERARVADLHAANQRSTGDPRGALGTDVVAFSDAPSLGRLRQVLDDAELAGEAVPHATLAGATGADPLVRLAVHFLGGEIDEVPARTEVPYSPRRIDSEAVAVAGLLHGRGARSHDPSRRQRNRGQRHRGLRSRVPAVRRIPQRTPTRSHRRVGRGEGEPNTACADVVGCWGSEWCGTKVLVSDDAGVPAARSACLATFKRNAASSGAV